MSKNLLNKKSPDIVQKLCITAVFMAMNIVLSSVSVPVPGGHLYLCDVVICLAAILLEPYYAFVVGGIGSFIGDFIFYPAPMFVSLISHGLQAVVISLFSNYVMKNHRMLSSAIGVSIGAVIMVTGYTLGRAFVYATPEYAAIKLPYEILQAVIGAVAGTLLCYKCGIYNLYQRLMKQI